MGRSLFMARVLAAVLGTVILCAAFLSSCSLAFGSRNSASSDSATTVQAAYVHLDVSDESAWNSAVAAGTVRTDSMLVKTSSAFNEDSFAGLGLTDDGQITLPGGTWHHLGVASGSAREAILALRKTAGVLVAEPENLLSLPKNETRSSSSNRISVYSTSRSARSLASKTDGTLETALDDPYIFSSQYNLGITDAFDAYETYPPYKAGTTIKPYAAVLDTGINLAHEDLSSGGNSYKAYSMFRTSSTSSPANGFSYVGGGTAPISVTASANWDDDGHGTHVAGIIGASGNNGVGTAGVMWEGLNLLSFKVLADTGSGANYSGSDWAVYGSLYHLATWWSARSDGTNAYNANSTQVTLPVNMSLGSFAASSFEAEILSYALAKNVLVVAAMGNDGKTTAEYPAAYSGVIGVGATDGTDARASFSTTGSWQSVCAPGFDIISTYNGSTKDYEYDSGTSMATPFVTGLIAYMIAYNPSLSPSQIKHVLESTADKIGGATGFTIDAGYGRVNVLKAVAGATNSTLTGEASTYCSTAAITVTVTSGGSPLGEVPVYLYDSTGNYVEAALTASAGNYSTTSSLDSSGAGTVSFWLLAPGSYVAKANRNGTAKSVSLTLGATAAAAGTIAF